MRDHVDERASGDFGHTEETDEEQEGPDFRQRAAQLGYYRILGDPAEAFAELMRQLGLDLDALRDAVVRFERDADAFTLELSRPVTVGGVVFGQAVRGRVGDGALEDLEGVEDERGSIGRFPPD